MRLRPAGQSGRGYAGNAQRPPPSPLFAALDANHDGVIDAQEIANAPAALKALDKNNDGQLTRDELMPPRRGPGGPNNNAGGPPGRGLRNRAAGGPPSGATANDAQRPPLPPLIAALDANHDGVIDAQEIANAPAALKTLDKNSDGTLTRDELRPPWAGPRGPRGGPRGRGPGGPPSDNQDNAPPADN